MFERSQPYVDDVLGELIRRRGSWRGTVALGSAAPVELALPGGRRSPDPDAIELARNAATQFDAAAADITLELNDHRVTYEAADPAVGRVEPDFVTVTTLEGQLMLEFGYVVPWDDEHTLGARVHDGRLVELCGSVIRP